MRILASDVVPFTLKINDDDVMDIETENDRLGASQAIVEATDSIPKGGTMPTKPKDVAIKIRKDGATIQSVVCFLDFATVRSPKMFIVADIIKSAILGCRKSG